jgi:hypothetical protein
VFFTPNPVPDIARLLPANRVLILDGPVAFKALQRWNDLHPVFGEE